MIARFFELMIGDGMNHTGDVRIHALLRFEQLLRQIRMRTRS